MAARDEMIRGLVRSLNVSFPEEMRIISAMLTRPKRKNSVLVLEFMNVIIREKFSSTVSTAQIIVI
jgi:hypothetical protein